MTTKYAFLDTNLFLHFRPLEEIDWRSELKTDDLTLIIAPIVIRELNRQKDSSGNKQLRRRAARALKRLDEFSSAPTLRDGVRVQFQTADPQIDFAQHKLSPQISDDWLIASALEFAIDHHDVCVVSDDLGLRMKLKAHSIPTFRLGEEYRLPEERDPDQKLIGQLHEEIRTLKNRLPDIKLAFADGTDRLNVTMNRKAGLTQDELDSKMQNLRIRFPKRLKRDGYSGADLARGTIASPAAVDAYNARLDHFYSEVLDYVRAYESAVDSQNRRFCLELVLVNAGTAPAEDIDVSVSLPEGIEAFGPDELSQPPVEPEPPSMPLEHGTAAGLDAAELLHSMGRPAPTAAVTERPTIWSNVSRPTIRESNRRVVVYNVKEVKHLYRVPLGQFYVSFVSWEAAKSFGIEYSLLARNLPTPVQGRLNIVLTVER